MSRVFNIAVLLAISCGGSASKAPAKGSSGANSTPEAPAPPESRPTADAAAPKPPQAPCGRYDAKAGAALDSITFESGAKVVLGSGGGTLERRFFIEGDVVRIEGGLALQRVDADTLLEKEGLGAGAYHRSAAPAAACVSSPAELAPTCFDRAEALRRNGQVGPSQDAHQACCDGGNMSSCGAYGVLLMVRTGKAKEGLAYIHRACDAGDRESCMALMNLAAEHDGPPGAP
jgi:hypothetical protein